MSRNAPTTFWKGQHASKNPFYNFFTVVFTALYNLFQLFTFFLTFCCTVFYEAVGMVGDFGAGDSGGLDGCLNGHLSSSDGCLNQPLSLSDGRFNGCLSSCNGCLNRLVSL